MSERGREKQETFLPSSTAPPQQLEQQGRYTAGMKDIEGLEVGRQIEGNMLLWLRLKSEPEKNLGDNNTYGT